MAEFTDRELEVMTVLWDLGSGTVTEVRDRLRGDFAYTTVLSVLRTLVGKGHVRHEDEGKAYRFFPIVARHEASVNGLRRLMDTLFAGSAEALLTQLVNDRGLTREKLARMRTLLDERLRDGELD